MKTLTKATLVETIINQTSITKAEMARDTANLLIEIHKEALFTRKAVYFIKCGRIAVRLKSARIGRNPKTGLEAIIAERHSITFTSRESERAGKLNQTALRAVLAEHGYITRDANILCNIWYNFIRQILTGKVRIELRGLGVFYPKIVKAGKVVRNPKTGENFVHEGSVMPAFRCSPSLRKAIDAQYL